MLGIQIGWTRIFSFMIWYHFAFLVISTAMLGFTVGGLLLNLRPKLLERARADLLFPSALGFCVTSAVALLIVCNLPFDGGVLDTLPNFGLFLVLILVVSAGFAAAGLFTSVMIARRPTGVARIYAANLLGSGFGCALAVPLLDRLLPASTVLAFALIAWLAMLLLIPGTQHRRRASVVALVTFVAVGAGLLSSLDPLAAPFYMSSTKAFPNWNKQRIIARLSNSLSTVDVFKAEELTGLWGLSDQRYALDTHGRPIPDRVGFCIDGWALTFGYHAQGDIVSEPVFDYLPSTLAYDVASPKSALVIGAGGGIDVICGLRRGVQSITAVEINAITLDVSLAMSEFNGRIFERSGVEPVVAEGRAFVAAAGARRWDLIQLSGVDTLAASQAGAFTLAESYLYTREAFESYLQHLNPGGVLTLTRWMSDPPRQTLRVITIADAALRRRGITDTAPHIMLVTDVRRGFSVFLISTTPFSEAQSLQALAASRAKGFIPLALPFQRVAEPPNVYEALLAAPDKASFVRDYPFDISVTTDDKPFFFEHTKWKNAWKYPDRIFDKFNGHLILIVTALVVALLGAIFILVPARFGLSREQRGRGHHRVLAYFACLGLGYVLVEMVLVQKLTLYLGNPSYALAVVLCGMLVCSGVGSLLSVKLRARPFGVVLAASAVAVSLIAYRFGLDVCLQATLAQPVAIRIALALALLGLPATLMGMPFPAAVASLGDAQRQLVVRGWVINGYCSVLGSCCAMILSISVGFHVVLLTGAAIYGLAAVLWTGRASSEPA
jgi:spermidine synthase